MEYNFRDIEKKWRSEWVKRGTNRVTEQTDKPKYYVLDMFPYPSGAGLHVGHPLGYIASDIIARYKKLRGFNVLHPMGYDSFGLPAEQYAIQTGQHPAITTANNIERYRDQLDKIGFCYDWDREVRTSNPDYYKWTQWIFGLIFNSWYNKDTDKAEPIETLIAKFEDNGTYNVNAATDENWFRNLPQDKFPFFGKNFEGDFTDTDWKSMNEEQQQLVLMQFRLTYLADSVVNWCPALGTVLANDEVKDGVSERGGHPVEQRLMRQWSMRISAYADRLLRDLDELDWNESIKEIQRNWIGKSQGASVHFQLDGHNNSIEVFTTRPDTIFGVSFMTLAPEHELVDIITTDEYRSQVESYVAQAKLKTERDRQSDVKNVSGQFTGAYVVHPFTGNKIPVWIGEYVLAGYGTGAVMAVPAGDQRDYDFARKYNLPIPNIFRNVDISEKAEASKDAVLENSSFLDGLTGYEALPVIIQEIEKAGVGRGATNYRLRDAVFSRQRYWGEPIPVYYKNDIPYLIPTERLPVVLPEVDKYLPTEDGEPPLARAKDWTYKTADGEYRMEYNTMPGWAGSSWYFLRYMDPRNESEFASRDKVDYWNQVDFYVGGAEHATGHLLYSRFWTKVLSDRGCIGFSEPFKKMINQGMITGRSSIAYRINISSSPMNNPPVSESFMVSKEHFDALSDNESAQSYLKSLIEKNYPESKALSILNGKSITISKSQFNVEISLTDSDILDIEAFKKWRPEFEKATFIPNSEGKVLCGWEIEKMSKSKYNVQTPDELVEKFGADTLRCYEMFLGPVEQSKPWDTKGINGVHNFLRKFWRLCHDASNNFSLSDDAPTKEELKTLHKTIRKITEDLDRLSWNTCISAFMICTNELGEQKCNKRSVLESLMVLLSPFAPYMSEELWEKAGHSTSVTAQSWPQWNEEHLKEDAFEYPVSFNGKTRFFVPLPLDMPKEEVEKAVLSHEQADKYLEGKAPKKVIVVPGRIVNVVV